MSRITIADLEVFYCVGITPEERANPQRLLVTVDMKFDFSVAAVSDRIEKTINYHAVSEELLAYGKNRTWKLIERVASNIADVVMAKYKPEAVLVEVKKFPIAQARYVSVTVTRSKAS
jgi:FolB domain-containing protein